MRLAFLARPLYLTRSNPNWRFITRNTCSTLDRICALGRFLRRCNWSMICLYLARREVISCA